MKKISVIGFGKIGQAVAANILTHNVSVNAVDINIELAESFKTNKFISNELGIAKILLKNFHNRKLTVTNNYNSIKDSQAVIVCIPLLITESKKIIKKTFLDCLEKIAPLLSNKCLLSVETTIPVGFSRGTIIPLLESLGKKHGTDFYLTYSPERIKSGTMLKQLLQNPKIIGGIDNKALEKGKEIYNLFFNKKQLQTVSSIECAEMIKLAGMVYRDINIAISNQLAIFSQKTGIDYTEVLKLTNTDGEAFLLNPGIGVGGHCTPVYPYFLIENFNEKGLDFTLAKESRKINDKMAAYAVKLIDEDIEQKKALILGLGFRPDVKEDSFSTSYILHKTLKEKNYKVFLHDPLFSNHEIKAKKFIPTNNIYSANAKVVFLVTNHSTYTNINWKKLRKSGCNCFVDGRNSFDKKTVESAGIKYVGIGK